MIVPRIDRAACSFTIEALRRSRARSNFGTSSGQTATNSPFGIGQLLPVLITVMAQDIDSGVYPGDASNITSAAAGMDHIIHAADSHGIGADVLRAGRAIAQRAIDAGHGNDGFARLTAMLTD